MRLEVLGCHGGEVPGRRLPAFLIDDRVLLEAGGVTAALPLPRQARIHYVLLSHAHLDHVAGLAFLADNVQSAPGRVAPVSVASLAPVVEDLRLHCFNNRLWPDFTALPSREAPVLRLQALAAGSRTSFGDLTVIPVPVQHATPAAGFVITDGRSGFVFSGDTGPTTDLWQAAREVAEVQAIVVETAFPNRLEPLARAAGHLTPALLEKELAKAPDAPVWVYHVKPSHYDETADELSRLGSRVQLLQQDRTYTF